MKVFLSTVAFLVISTLAHADEAKEDKKKAEWHCEKADGSGDIEEAKTKKDCKKAGGKWEKAHADGHSHDKK